jgi:transposase-like protein
LSYRDLVAIMAERNVDVAHTTILRWVQRYVPKFEKCWQRYARPVGTSWRVDEIYLKVKCKRVYLYRAVDRAGQTVDFLLSEHRDIAAAKRFFARAIAKRGVPQKITIDGYAASHAAVAALQEEGVLPTNLTVRANKYLNSTTPLSILCRTKERNSLREMIRLTLWALSEAEEEIKPATEGGQRPEAVFFSGGEVAEIHTRENITSDDDAARARTALRNDRILTPL